MEDTDKEVECQLADRAQRQRLRKKKHRGAVSSISGRTRLERRHRGSRRVTGQKILAGT